MMKPIVSLIALLGIISCSMPIFSQARDKLHTPPPGSAERKAILDALRRDYIQPHKGQLTFKVRYLKAHNGWAWIYADPQSSEAGDEFGETGGFLLHITSDGWKVMPLPTMPDDPSDPEDLVFSRAEAKVIQRKYPSVPLDIFPIE